MFVYCLPRGLPYLLYKIAAIPENTQRYIQYPSKCSRVSIYEIRAIYNFLSVRYQLNGCVYGVYFFSNVHIYYAVQGGIFK